MPRLGAAGSRAAASRRAARRAAPRRAGRQRARHRSASSFASAPAAGWRCEQPHRSWRPDSWRARIDRCAHRGRSRRGSRGARRQRLVLSVSTDAIVRPHGLLDGLLGWSAESRDNLLERGRARYCSERSRHGRAGRPARRLAPDARRRQQPWTGRGIGVAVIDSGLEMSAEFTGRVTAFYDFTNGGTSLTQPYRRVRARHARRRHHRRLGRLLLEQRRIAVSRQK